jgi:transposase-like protein
VGQKRKKVALGLAERETAIEHWRNGAGVVEIATTLGVHRNTVNGWVRGLMRERVAGGDLELDPRDQRIEELLQQIGALEGTVGRQAMEIRFFKGALRRVEVSRQRKKDNGGTASTPKSEA